MLEDTEEDKKEETEEERKKREEKAEQEKKEEACLALLDRGCPGSGALTVALTNDAIAARWSLSKTTVEECPSAKALSFATNLADGNNEFCALHSTNDKFNWIKNRAIAADHWNRGFEMNNLLNGVLSAFHGETEVLHPSQLRSKGKSAPRTQRFGRMREIMREPAPAFSIVKFDTIACNFSNGTAELKPDKLALRRLIKDLDDANASLHLLNTCWSIEIFDERAQKKREREEAEEAKEAKEAKVAA